MASMEHRRRPTDGSGDAAIVAEPARVRRQRAHRCGRGRDSAERRVDRWRAGCFMIIQCAVTAGSGLAAGSGGARHTRRRSSPRSPRSSRLGVTFGQRLRRGIEVAIGVAVGVLVGDLLVIVFGTGAVADHASCCAMAMSLATLLGAGQLMIIQAGVQSIIVITLTPMPGQGLNRWLDAVVGCAIALVVATIAPSAPLRKPRLVAAAMLQELAATLDAAGRALRTGDAEAADAGAGPGPGRRDGPGGPGARRPRKGWPWSATPPSVAATCRPCRRTPTCNEPLDHASRNLRVLARRCAVALWRDETVPAGYLSLMDALAEHRTVHGRRALRPASCPPPPETRWSNSAAHSSHAAPGRHHVRRRDLGPDSGRSSPTCWSSPGSTTSRRGAASPTWTEGVRESICAPPERLLEFIRRRGVEQLGSSLGS